MPLSLLDKGSAVALVLLAFAFPFLVVQSRRGASVNKDFMQYHVGSEAEVDVQSRVERHPGASKNLKSSRALGAMVKSHGNEKADVTEVHAAQKFYEEPRQKEKYEREKDQERRQFTSVAQRASSTESVHVARKYPKDWISANDSQAKLTSEPVATHQQHHVHHKPHKHRNHRNHGNHENHHEVLEVNQLMAKLVSSEHHRVGGLEAGLPSLLSKIFKELKHEERSTVYNQTTLDEIYAGKGNDMWLTGSATNCKGIWIYAGDEGHTWAVKTKHLPTSQDLCKINPKIKPERAFTWNEEANMHFILDSGEDPKCLADWGGKGLRHYVDKRRVQVLLPSTKLIHTGGSYNCEHDKLRTKRGCASPKGKGLTNSSVLIKGPPTKDEWLDLSIQNFQRKFYDCSKDDREKAELQEILKQRGFAAQSLPAAATILVFIFHWLIA